MHRLAGNSERVGGKVTLSYKPSDGMALSLINLVLKSQLINYCIMIVSGRNVTGFFVQPWLSLFVCSIQPWRVLCARTVDADSALHNMLPLDFN